MHAELLVWEMSLLKMFHIFQTCISNYIEVHNVAELGLQPLSTLSTTNQFLTALNPPHWTVSTLYNAFFHYKSGKILQSSYSCIDFFLPI